MKKAWTLSYPLSAQRRLWSDWADAQADLSLRWAHSHIVGFVTRRLIYVALDDCILFRMILSFIDNTVIVLLTIRWLSYWQYGDCLIDNTVIVLLTIRWLSQTFTDNPRSEWTCLTPIYTLILIILILLDTIMSCRNVSFDQIVLAGPHT